MLSYIARRLLLTIPTLLGVTFLVFAVVRLQPGDPAQEIAGQGATREILEAIRQELGLDRPFLTQYFDFMEKLFRGDLGKSLKTKEPVAPKIWGRFLHTLELTLAAMVVAILIGSVAGIISAMRPYSLWDNVSMFGALFGVSMPVFWQGIMLMLVFSLWLQQWIGWGLPATGRGTLLHLILPAITLGTSSAAIIARMVRSTMLEILRQEYILTAQAKGASQRSVIFKHALRNALIPVVTVVGLAFGGLLSGAVLTETVFAWPGIGRLIVEEGILTRDYPIVQGAILLVALGFVLVNLLVDLFYAYIDPRIRYD
ncbi:ABC transporter permease [Candidatus Acetothermia bacterium]|jgi:peptide/nickel transport system permease protein/oligopeptide transport system permease protein|nr:ABC transporter permease [Candidatus Acetothermia bacterium]MCI2431710.1 ABC transporter permease [Candidatus Acetothermia bacterium]MCI2436694.1 ABC transporter permease [Candidatus Acetothermia bacterium]